MQREGWAGTVPKQALEPGPVVGGDPHRPVEAEAAGAPPCEHVFGVYFGEQPAADVQPQDPLLHDRREGPCALRIQGSGRTKSQCVSLPVEFPREQPVGDCKMEM
jgi:hypothetical protein